MLLVILCCEHVSTAGFHINLKVQRIYVSIADFHINLKAQRIYVSTTGFQLESAKQLKVVSSLNTGALTPQMLHFMFL